MFDDWVWGGVWKCHWLVPFGEVRLDVVGMRATALIGVVVSLLEDLRPKRGPLFRHLEPAGAPFDVFSRRFEGLVIKILVGNQSGVSSQVEKAHHQVLDGQLPAFKCIGADQVKQRLPVDVVQ